MYIIVNVHLEEIIVVIPIVIPVEATSRPVQCMHVTGPSNSINQFTVTGSTAACTSPATATSVNQLSLVIA
jgi:hypothetical protein